jgi:hypothetical protein
MSDASEELSVLCCRIDDSAIVHAPEGAAVLAVLGTISITMSCVATPVVARVSTTRAQCTTTRAATPTAARMQLRMPTVLRRASLQQPKLSAVGRRVVSNRRAAAVVVRAAADDEFDGYTAGTAFLFPGQGAQSVGMAAATCAELPAAKALFDKASEILGYDLLALCTDGPAEKLNSTAGAAPLSKSP